MLPELQYLQDRITELQKIADYYLRLKAQLESDQQSLNQQHSELKNEQQTLLKKNKQLFLQRHKLGKSLLRFASHN